MASTLAEMSRIALVRDFPPHRSQRGAKSCCMRPIRAVLPHLSGSAICQSRASPGEAWCQGPHRQLVSPLIDCRRHCCRRAQRGLRQHGAVERRRAGPRPRGRWLGAATDRSGRVIVNCRFVDKPGHPDVFFFCDRRYSPRCRAVTESAGSQVKGANGDARCPRSLPISGRPIRRAGYSPPRACTESTTAVSGIGTKGDLSHCRP